MGRNIGGRVHCPRSADLPSRLIWVILLCEPGEPLSLCGPLLSEASGQGAPRPSWALPGGDPISSRAHAQLAQDAWWLLRAARTLGSNFSLTFPKFHPLQAHPVGFAPSRSPPCARRGLPSGGHSHSPSASWAKGGPRSRGGATSPAERPPIG